MHLHLIDTTPALVNAWFDAFADFPEVEIQHGDLLKVAHDCIVSPANSYGFMDGGIDAAYRDFFGPQIEKTVQAAINLRPEGLLPVGASIIVPTGNARIPHLIVAPTMVMPEMVESLHCQRAMRAVLRMARQHPNLCSHIFCPGLANRGRSGSTSSRCVGNGSSLQGLESLSLVRSPFKWHLNTTSHPNYSNSSTCSH